MPAMDTPLRDEIKEGINLKPLFKHMQTPLRKEIEFKHMQTPLHKQIEKGLQLKIHASWKEELKKATLTWVRLKANSFPTLAGMNLSRPDFPLP